MHAPNLNPRCISSCVYAVGPLCTYETNIVAEVVLSECDSDLRQYEAVLTPPASDCGSGTSTNVFTWTPDENTPDLVYYQVCVCVCVCVYVCSNWVICSSRFFPMQCASHRNLGWQISVEGKPDIGGPDNGGPDNGGPDIGGPDDGGPDNMDGASSSPYTCTSLSVSLSLTVLALLYLTFQ